MPTGLARSAMEIDGCHRDPCGTRISAGANARCDERAGICHLPDGAGAYEALLRDRR
jgi:hypothetical protein